MEVFKRETAKHYTTKKADVSLFLFYPEFPSLTGSVRSQGKCIFMKRRTELS